MKQLLIIGKIIVLTCKRYQWLVLHVTLDKLIDGGVLLAQYMVQLKNITKSFDEVKAVSNISLNIKEGEFLTLLGPSGCGKTTTLRMIAGFERPTSGDILINGKKVDNVEPYNRTVNTVFQSYSLFPHMNVYDNVAFGLKMKKVKKAEITERVQKALQLVQLDDYGNRKPAQLSGGQQQRIAIARAIVNNPQVLLLDEPLGALDLKLRKQMQLELKHLQQTLNITFIYVTHDQEEALTMSDRIVIMNAGHIEQIGVPTEIYEQPATRFVADFIGETNIIEGKITGFTEEFASVQFNNQNIQIPNNGEYKVNDHISMSIRPENAIIHTVKKDLPIVLSGKITDKIYVGSSTKAVVEFSGGEKFLINQTNGVLDGIGENREIYVSWPPESAVILKG